MKIFHGLNAWRVKRALLYSPNVQGRAGQEGFGWALLALRSGRVIRVEWNGSYLKIYTGENQ